MKFKKIFAIICTVALICSMLAGCGGENTREVLSVNGESVSVGKFTFYLESMKEMIAYESQFDVTDENSWATFEIDNKKAIDVAKEKAVEDVVSVMVQVQKAKAEGIVLTDDDKLEINKQKNSIIQNFGGQSVFDEQLKAWKISSQTFDQIMQDYMYASKLQAKYSAENEDINNIGEEEIQAKYDSEKEYAIRNSIFVKHILKMPQAATETTPEVTKEEAKAMADDIYAKILAGEDFEKLMMEHTDDSEVSYDGYSFSHNDGQFDIDFDNASYALSVGEVSNVIETQFGYHIIKRYESDIQIPSLDEVKDSVIAQIKNERYQTLVAEKWIPEANVVKSDDVLNGLK